MGRPRKVTTSTSIEEPSEKLPMETMSENVAEDSSDDVQEEVVEKDTKSVEKSSKGSKVKEVSERSICPVCSTKESPRYHENNFDGPGIGHWPFSPGTKAERQFEFFCSEPIKTIFIPYLPGEKPGTLQTPTINGLKIGIRKGMYVDVPKGIADVIMDSLNQTAKAEMETRLAPNPYTGEKRFARLDQQDDVSKQILNG